MSAQIERVASRDDVPSFQPWLKLSLASFLPVTVSFFVPQSFMWYLIGLTGLGLATAVGMLIVQERRAGRDRR